jgi:excisionase family DNA binding protein
MMATATWRLLSAHEAADRLNVPVKKLYELIQAGDLRSIRIGRLHKVHPEELERFVREGGAE